MSSNKHSFSRKIYQKLYYQLCKRHFFAITGPLRVLPNFIVIGAVRSGTTSLFHYFSQHPCVSPSSYDELGFFDSNFDLGLNWYRSHFPTKYHKQKIISRHGNFMTYEVTPFYIWNKLVAERIAQILPNVKLIAQLRNPIDRAYSNYQLSVRNGEKSSFEDAINFEIQEQEQRSKKQNSEIYTEMAFGLKNYLSRGIYAEQLQIWLNLFSKQQIFILSTEQLAENVNDNLNNMFQFLGISKYKIPNIERKKVAKYPPMKEKTREFLIEYYRGHNQRLFKLIGKNFDWEK